MNAPPEAIDRSSEAQRDDSLEAETHRASRALQRALNDESAVWLPSNVRDQRKCDHPLLPAELPDTIRVKVARLLQTCSNDEKDLRARKAEEDADAKLPWRQQLEQHVTWLLQQLRAHPKQFRAMLLAAAESSADCSDSLATLSLGFADNRSAYRRLRRAALALGGEVYNLVQAFVRRSEANGVFPVEAQVVRLASLYKLELRRHVTADTVLQCIRTANSGPHAVPTQLQTLKRMSTNVSKKNTKRQSTLQRQVASAGVTTDESKVSLSLRAASAPAQASRRATLKQLTPGTERVKTVHAFKMQALERLLAATWQSHRDVSMRSLNTGHNSPVRVSEATQTLIQERVTAFLYHRSRENFPLWSAPSFSREETARHLRLLIATLLTTPLLQGVSIDQLLEMARVMTWEVITPDQTFCVGGAEIDTFIVVMEGVLASPPSAESTGSHPTNVCVPTGISAPACLGALGMVRNTEQWPQTLCAQAPGGVKVLSLSRSAFETLLSRFVGGGKPPSSALAVSSHLHQPQRPSSSPAGVARRLALSLTNYSLGRRPSTAISTSAKADNIARWHEVRDEKLREYHAGLEAERRVAALAALAGSPSSTKEDSPSSSDTEEVEDAEQSSIIVSKTPWSRHQHYPSYNPPSPSPEKGMNTLPLRMKQPFAIAGDGVATPIQETADQLRERYKALNAHRASIRASLTSSAVLSAQISKLDLELAHEASKPGLEHGRTATSASSWWLEGESTDSTSSQLERKARSPLDAEFSPEFQPDSSPTRRSPTVKSVNRRPSSPSKGGQAPTSPSLATDESINSIRRAIEPEDDDRESSNDEQDETVRSSDEPETVESETDDEQQQQASQSLSATDGKTTASTRARKSVLDLLLTSHSSVASARRSKLLDQQSAQQVLIQKHFTDSASLKDGVISPSGWLELQNRPNDAPLPLRADLQRRMDAVLTELRLTPKLKLELVLKYTQTDHYDRFPRAVELWELALHSVLLREQALRSLRRFELLASDPRRHFRSLSTQRLREEKQRDLLFSKLNQASEACVHVIQQLTQLAGDTVYLNDRIYSDKMKKDYTELLYEVEQERLQIIYQGVRPHVASAVEEEDEAREEDATASSRPASGRTVVNVRVPTVSPFLLPHPPPKRIPTSKNAPSSKTCQKANQPEFTVEGETAEPTDVRYRLATDRESIFVAIRDLDTMKRDGPKALEAEPPVRRASKVAEQVQKQRQAELQALAKQLEAEASQPSPHTGEKNNSKLDMQTPRIPEKLLKKRVSSLQELFKQLLMRPNS